MNTIYRKVYRGVMNGNGNDLAIVWVTRERDRDNNRTLWRGGVTFGTATIYGTKTSCYDGISWRTTLQAAPRASKSRDNNAVDTLYTIICETDQTIEELADMDVYKDVYNDVMRSNGAWL